MSFEIELAGVEVFAHHGVTETEREQGQRFLFDVWVDVSESARFDQLDETVDYREIAACVKEIATGRQFHLLEALAAEVADALLERFEVERVRLRVRKPDVELDPPADYSAVSVERSAE